MMLNKVVVCGVGLIGGSFALALKAAGAVGEVVGLGRRQASLVAAQQRGVIDRIASDWADALQDADLVFLAMPVGQMLPVMQALAPHLPPDAIVTDGGSTKLDVVAAARIAFGEKIAQFVPGHPIAGAEKSGVEAAQANLFQDKRVVLTPLAENSATRVALVQRAWEACGAQVSQLDAAAHDQVFAAVSHLPHLLAFALVHEFAQRADADQLFGFAAGGFRDFTRIASSHPEMWRDICLANRAALLVELDTYMAELMRTRSLLAEGNAAGLEQMFCTARQRRDAWLDSLAPLPEE
jgi:prephenate dehydrogenase